MSRTYFKKTMNKGNLFEFCKKNGANYIEDGLGIWIVPKKYGDYRIAIALAEDGLISFGEINESCENFEGTRTCGDIYRGEQKWIIEVLTRLQKYVPKKK